jgi:ketosteroid isomerase-like protein
MSADNVETVRRIYELGAEQWTDRVGDSGSFRGRVRELWDPELVIEENAAFPDRATYRGYEGLGRWWDAFYEIYDDLRIEPREFVPAGDRVVVHAHHWMLSKAGVALERDITHVWTVRNGRAVHVTGYMDRAEALATVGIAE